MSEVVLLGLQCTAPGDHSMPELKHDKRYKQDIKYVIYYDPETVYIGFVNKLLYIHNMLFQTVDFLSIVLRIILMLLR